MLEVNNIIISRFDLLTTQSLYVGEDVLLLC